MQMVVDAELDVDSGAQPFYFAADPRMADTVEVDYLNGVETPGRLRCRPTLTGSDSATASTATAGLRCLAIGSCQKSGKGIRGED